MWIGMLIGFMIGVTVICLAGAYCNEIGNFISDIESKLYEWKERVDEKRRNR